MKTVFIVTPEVQAKIKDILEYAHKPENWYKAYESPWVPGDKSQYVLVTGTVRIVYSVTETQETDESISRIWRHISISNKTKLPNPIVVWNICRWFGFTLSYNIEDHESIIEPDPSWYIHVDRIGQHVAVVQPIFDA